MSDTKNKISTRLFHYWPFILSLMCISQIVLAENVTDYQAEVTATSGLNVRTGAGTQYSKISTLKYGTTVTVTHEYGSWSKIDLGPGKSAYVYNRYLRRAGSTGSPSTSPINTASRDVNVSDYQATVTASVLNVRSGAGTGNGIVGKRYRGSTVTVTHHQGGWRKISWRSGVSAYVHGNYVKKILRNTGSDPEGLMPLSRETADSAGSGDATKAESTTAIREQADPVVWDQKTEIQWFGERPLDGARGCRRGSVGCVIYSDTEAILWVNEGDVISKHYYVWTAEGWKAVKNEQWINNQYVRYDFENPENDIRPTRPTREHTPGRYEIMQEHYDPNGDKYSGYPMHISPGMFPDGPISPDYDDYVVEPDPIISTVTGFCGLPFTSTSPESVAGSAYTVTDVAVNGISASTFLIPIACEALRMANENQGTPTIYGPNPQNMPYGNGLPR